MSQRNLIFLDVDTQVDFMEPVGRLYVPGAEAIRGNAERLFAFACRHHVPVLSSVDAHTADDPEFAQWPPHCVRGTPGQEKVPATLMARRCTLEPDSPPPADLLYLLANCGQLVFPKPTLDAFDNPHFTRVIELLPESQYVVFGVATDYCVNLAARGLLRRGRRVKIVRDAVRGISAEAEARVCRELSAMGAQWVDTAEVAAEACMLPEEPR